MLHILIELNKYKRINTEIRHSKTNLQVVIILNKIDPTLPHPQPLLPLAHSSHPIRAVPCLAKPGDSAAHHRCRPGAVIPSQAGSGNWEARGTSQSALEQGKGAGASVPAEERSCSLGPQR